MRVRLQADGIGFCSVVLPAIPVNGGATVVLVTTKEMFEVPLEGGGECVLFTLSLISDAATKSANSPVGTLEDAVEEDIAVVSTTVGEDATAVVEAEETEIEDGVDARPPDDAEVVTVEEA